MPLELLFSEQDIDAAVKRIAASVREVYRGETILLIGVLKGAFVFLADLIREIDMPLEVDFVRARSYGSGTRSKGSVDFSKDVEVDLQDRHVLVVEDIADTGLTMDAVVARLQTGGPGSVRRCALLVREGCPTPDFFGYTVGPGFVVGYGIDYAERYRGLRDIRVLPEEAE